MELITIFILVVVIIIAFIIGKYFGRKISIEEIELQRRDAINRSRAVLGGQFAENLAPYFPDFPFSPTECRFIGKPIDFLVFNGMDEKNVNEIVFVEVKTGKSKLSTQEKNVKKAIEEKKIRYVEYRLPDDFNKNRL